MAGHSFAPRAARHLALVALTLWAPGYDVDRFAAPAAASSTKPRPGPWTYLQPCVVTSDNPSEVVYRELPATTSAIAALDNGLYIATEDGILREDGELFIPTAAPPGYLTASGGYLYWLQPARSGSHTLYASLGEFDTARELGDIAAIDARLVPLRGGVAVTPFTRALYIWSATRPGELIDNCPVEWYNTILVAASHGEDILWRNSPTYCMRTREERRPKFIELPDHAFGAALDETSIYFETTITAQDPTRIFRRPIHGGPDVLIASVEPEGSTLIVDDGSIFWAGLGGQLDRAPTSGKDDEGEETVACDVSSYAVSRDYVYWTTPVKPTNGRRTLMRRRR